MSELRCLSCGEIREKHSWLSGLCPGAKSFWKPDERIGVPNWAKAACPRCGGTGCTLSGRACPWCAARVNASAAIQAKFVERVRPPLDWAKPTPFNHFPDLEGWVSSHYEVLSKDS